MPASRAASVIDTRAMVYDPVRICLYGVCPDVLYHRVISVVLHSVVLGLVRRIRQVAPAHCSFRGLLWCNTV